MDVFSRFAKYAKAQLSLEEILLILDLSEEDANVLFEDIRSGGLKEHYLALRTEGKADLLCAQYESGIDKKNSALLIHLGCHWADQTKESANNSPSVVIIDDSSNVEYEV